MVLLALFSVAACVYDYRQRRIPNRLVGIMWIVGLVVNMVRGGPGDTIRGLTVSAVVLMFFYLFFKIGVLGAGDVKLLAVSAEYLDPHKIPVFLFATFLVAAVFSLIKMIYLRNVLERLEYLGQYLTSVVLTGQWQLYVRNRKEETKSSICLAGPLLCSALLCLGGIY